MAGSPSMSAPAVYFFFILFSLVATAYSAPVDEEDSTTLSDPHATQISEYYGGTNSTSCYYNYQQYQEGDRIITQEPCLNCTCQNRMLMCYLRVCPYTKDVGQDCTVEKRPDQCCPVITCPQVPVQLQLQASSTTLAPTTTAIAHRNSYGCEFNGAFFPDGAQVPPDPKNPCELCYCIRNRTACVLQECTLNVDGCRPVYQKGVCCPVRYDCDYDKLSTTTESSNGLVITTTAETPQQCQYEGVHYNDGELIAPGRSSMSSCERCYCMRGEIVCAVQNCGNPMEGKDCEPVPPPPGQCCPTNYICANETIPIDESDASKLHSDSLSTDAPILDKDAMQMPEDATTQSAINPETSNNFESKPVTESDLSLQPGHEHADSEQASSQVVPEGETIDLSGEPVEITTVVDTDKVATENVESTSASTEDGDKEKGESIPAVESETMTTHEPNAEPEIIESATVINIKNPHPVEIDEPEQSSGETMGEHEKDDPTHNVPVHGSDKTMTEAPSHPTDASVESGEHSTESVEKVPEGGESDPIEQDEEEVPEVNHETEHPESGIENEKEHEPEVIVGTTSSPIEISKTPDEVASQTGVDGVRATDAPSIESEATESSTTEKDVTEEKPEANEPVISNTIPQEIEHDEVENDDDDPEPVVVHQAEEDHQSPQVTESSGETVKPVVEEINPTTVEPVANVELEPQPPKEEVHSETVAENVKTPSPDDSHKNVAEEELTTIGAIVSGATQSSPAETSEHDSDTQTVASSIHEEKTSKPIEENEISSVNDHTEKPVQDNENDNAGDATTAQVIEKGTVPGEGSCLIDGVTYSDGADIPTSSPCHTECKCHSSIVNCKLMECPPPPSYLTNCIPIPQGEDSCCPVYSCDDKKTHPLLESQSQIGGETTEHDEQRVEETHTSETINEIAIVTTEAASKADQVDPESTPTENEKPLPSATSTPEEAPAQETVNTEDKKDEAAEELEVVVPQVPEVNESQVPEVVVSQVPEVVVPQVPEVVESQVPEVVVPQVPENDDSDNDEAVEVTTKHVEENKQETLSTVQEENTHEDSETQKNEQAATEHDSTEPQPGIVEQSTSKPEVEGETESIQELDSGSVAGITTQGYDNDHHQQTTMETDKVEDQEAAIEHDLPSPHASEEPTEHEISHTPQDSEEPSDHEDPKPAETVAHQENDDISTTVSTQAPLLEETTSKHEEYEIQEITTLEPPSHESPPEESTSKTELSSEHVPSHSDDSDGVKYEVTDSATPENMEVTTQTIKEMSVEYVQTTISSHIHHEVADKNKVEEQTENVEQHTTEPEAHDVQQPNIPAILTGMSDNVEKDGMSHYEDNEQITTDDQTVKPAAESESEKDHQIESTTEVMQQHSDTPEEEDSLQQTTTRSDQLEDVTNIPPANVESELPIPENTDSPQPADGDMSEAADTTSSPSMHLQEHDEAEGVKETHKEVEITHGPEDSSTSNSDKLMTDEQPTTQQTEESSPETVPIHEDENKSEMEQTADAEVEVAVPQTTEGSESEHEIAEHSPVPHVPTTEVAEKEEEHLQTVEPSHESQDDELKKDHTTEIPEESETHDSTTEKLPLVVGEQEEVNQPENFPEHVTEHEEEPESHKAPAEDTPEVKPEHVPEVSTEGFEAPHEETTTVKLSTMVHEAESEVYSPSSVDHFSNLPMNTWTQKPFQPEVTSEPPRAPEEDHFHPPSAGETDYEEEEESVYEPGACRFGGKIFISAQQVPRENPCDFCFCFRSDIICLQQSCPPPILGCREESIHGFCCPRYECPVSMATTFNFTTTTTTTTTTLPPHFLAHNYRGAARRGGCQVQNKFYRVGDEIPTASGPCLQCICGANGQMKCDPKVCSPEPMIRKMIEEAERR